MNTKHNIGNIYKTNRDGDVILLNKVGKVATVRFINTGYERDVDIQNLVAGKCRDYTITERKYTTKEYPNVLMSSNNTGDFILLEKDGKDCVVQFVETGYTTKANWENLKNGKIRDPYFKSCYGCGYQGEYDKKYYTKQADQLWRNMLKRCYSEKDPRGYFGKGVTVDERWLCFANFQEDLPQLENFELWVNAHKNSTEKYNLDKDYLVEGNKVYSREVCMFLPESFNKSLGSKNRHKSGK